MHTIFLRKESRDYTKLSNELLRRKGMSGLAKAILFMMLSHKDGWKTTMKQLEESFSDGHKAIANAVHELELSGHAVMERIYDHKKKRPNGVLWKWYSHPDLSKDIVKRKWKSKVPLVKSDSSKKSLKTKETQVPDISMTIIQRRLSTKEDIVLKEEGSGRGMVITLAGLNLSPRKDYHLNHPNNSNHEPHLHSQRRQRNRVGA